MMKHAPIVLAMMVAAAGIACQQSVTGSPTIAPAPTLETTQAPAPAEGTADLVVLVKSGNILVWDDAAGQPHPLFEGGDAIGVSVSDDGGVIAFLRRSVVQLAADPWTSWREQSAIWAMDHDGGNLREVVSADALRGLIVAAETESAHVPQMDWIPGTHHLLFSAWRYIVQAEGESHAFPEGLFQVDMDSLSQSVLMPAGHPLRFTPSPDGRQIALMSPTGLGFINADGSNLRSGVLSFPEAGLTGPLLPAGVWTRDSRAVVMIGSFELDPTFNIGFTLWKVPADGTAPTALAAIQRSDPRSMTFSPDGRHAAFAQYAEQGSSGPTDWSIVLLPSDTGPLAIPRHEDLSYVGVHWSPDGRAFDSAMRQLCADATSAAQVCATPISFDGMAGAVHWLDTSRFLFLTREPSVLSLVTLDPSGAPSSTSVPIAAWPLEESADLNSFAAAAGQR